MKLVLSHPTANNFVRATADELMEKKMLYGFYTTVAAFPGNIFHRMGSIGPLSEMRRRSFASNLEPVTKMWPWRELGRFAAPKLGLRSLNKHETGMFSVDAVYQSLDRKVASSLKKASVQGVSAVYAYEDGALYSFLEAKKLHMQCLYDLPIGYWRAARRLLEPERERWPDWAATLTNFGDSEEKLSRKDEELKLANRIFVASRFTADTLKDFPGSLAPIEIIPYGFPSIGPERGYSKVSSINPLKLLFVGGLSQRKGVADMFAAVQTFGNKVSLTVVGRKASDNCPALDEALAKHTWIPSLPHKDVLALMREHDVLLFPSLFEGFGMVITEAMSQGTPVITTDRTAGPDLIKHGQNGWLVEAGSTAALQEAIEGLLKNPETIAEAGKNAKETAKLRPWDVYSCELVQAISENISKTE
jgi:glycosyltransferase involved in cell wall biosynthesis